jgi:hypothetical protein
MTYEENKAVSLLSSDSIINKVLALHLLIGLGWSASAIVSKLPHANNQRETKKLYFDVDHYCMIYHCNRRNGWSTKWFTVKMIECKNGLKSQEVLCYDNSIIARCVKNFYLSKKLRQYVQTKKQ